MARENGLSWSTLSLNVFQHFAPYNRAGHLLVYELSGLSPALGLALGLVNHAALLTACLWLLSELRVSARRRALALVLIGLSVPMTEVGVWFDTAMHVLPAIAATLAVCAAHVRGVRTGRNGWHVLAVVLFLLGQLTQERPLFALPLIVLVDLLLLWRHLPWAARWRLLWGQRAALAGLTVAALVVAAALQAFVVQPAYASPSWATVGRTMLSALSNYVVPSFVNQPASAPLGTGGEVGVLVAVLLVGVLLGRARPGNGGPLLFAAATFALYFGFLKFSPLLNDDTIAVNAQRLQNALYVTVPATVALVHLRLPRLRAATRRPAGPVRSPRVRRAVEAAACLTLAAYLLVSNDAYLDRQWAQTTQARAWLDAVRNDVDQWSDPSVTLVPLTAPAVMALGWSLPFAREDRLLGMIDKGFTPGDLGPRPVLIDDRGELQEAALARASRRTEIVSGRCARSGAGLADEVVVSVTPGVSRAPLFLLLRYQADRDLDVQLSAGWRTRWQGEAWSTRLSRGTHTQLLALDAARLTAIDLRSLTPGAGFCARDAAVVRPLTVEGGDRCRVVDRHGRPGAEVACPGEAGR